MSVISLPTHPIKARALHVANRADLAYQQAFALTSVAILTSDKDSFLGGLEPRLIAAYLSQIEAQLEHLKHAADELYSLAVEVER